MTYLNKKNINKVRTSKDILPYLSYRVSSSNQIFKECSEQWGKPTLNDKKESKKRTQNF